MILKLVILLLSLHTVISRRIVDCTGCGRYALKDTCELDGNEGYLYERSVTDGPGCDAQYCDTQMCDNSREYKQQRCTGLIVEPLCDGECEQKLRILHLEGGECTDVLVFEPCRGGDLCDIPEIGHTPGETYECSGCGRWVDVGECRDIPGAQFKWRHARQSPTCNSSECGAFACDISNICSGEFAEGECTADCTRKYRVWEVKDELCKDTVVYYPCFEHDHCSELE